MLPDDFAYIHSSKITDPNLWLSPLTEEILSHSVENGGISIVFSQSNLNLTPLLAAAVQAKEPSDVLIALAQRQFKRVYDNYSRGFLSLYHKQSVFFAQNALWCRAEFRGDQESEFVIGASGVRYRPMWGSQKFKNDFQDQLEQAWKRGDIADWPKIITMKLTEASLPPEILKIDNFRYGKEVKKLKSFRPRFVVVEGLNERSYSARPLIPLIQGLLKAGVGGVLHYSWPYVSHLADLEKWLGDLPSEDRNQIRVIHFSTRYGIEMKADFESYLCARHRTKSVQTIPRDSPAFERFSLEGDRWNQFYPQEGHDLRAGSSLVVPGTHSSLESALDTPGLFDRTLGRLWAAVDESTHGRARAMLLFPPFLDSFLRPDQMSFFSRDSMRTLPLQSWVNEVALSKYQRSAFLELIRCGVETVDMLHSLRGIATHRIPSKGAMLFDFIIRHVVGLSNADQILIGNYHTQYGSRRLLLDYLASCFEAINQGRLPDSSLHTVINWQGEVVSLDPQDLKLEVERQAEGFRLRVGSDKALLVRVAGLKDLRHLGPVDAAGSILLLPGPIPIFSYRDDRSHATEGFDALLKPFRKIFFFCFEGRNLRRMRDQTEVYAQLYDSEPNAVNRADLRFSQSLMLPQLTSCDVKGVPEKRSEANLDGLEESLRNENLKQEEDSVSEDQRTVFKVTVADVMSKKPTRPNVKSDPMDPREMLLVRIQFDEGNVEQVEIPTTSQIRVLGLSQSYFKLPSDLEPGDEICYIETSTRESLDEYFIRTYADLIDLELNDVLRPVVRLRQFADALLSISSGVEFDEIDWSQVDWLRVEQRYAIFEVVLLLLDPTIANEEFRERWRSALTRGMPWEALAALPSGPLDQIRKIWTRGRNASNSKMFKIINTLGLGVGLQHFSKLITHGEHYHFRNAKDMRVLGEFLGDEWVINNYEEINEAGRDVHRILQIVGQGISRHLQGTASEFNEIDLIIENQMQRGVVVGF